MNILFVEGMKKRMMEVAGLDEPKPAMDYLADDFDSKNKIVLYEGFKQLIKLYGRLYNLCNSIDPNAETEWSENAKTIRHEIGNLISFTKVFEPSLNIPGQKISKKALDPNSFANMNFKQKGYKDTRSVLMDIKGVVAYADSIANFLKNIHKHLMTATDTSTEASAISGKNQEAATIRREFTNFYFGKDGKSGFKSFIDNLFNDFNIKIEEFKE